MARVVTGLRELVRFYYDGFRTMSWWGRKVWIIILIKLFIMFLILRIFFFPISLRPDLVPTASGEITFWSN